MMCTVGGRQGAARWAAWRSCQACPGLGGLRPLLPQGGGRRGGKGQDVRGTRRPWGQGKGGGAVGEVGGACLPTPREL